MGVVVDSALPGLVPLFRMRRSVRRFDRRPIPREVLRSILDAADAAPSAGDLQAYKIVCVQDASTRCALAEAAQQQIFVAQAPVVLVFLADTERSSARYGWRGAELYGVQDASIACAYAQLQAHVLGLGSTWVGAFDERTVAHLLQAPKGMRPVAMLPLGYPAEQPEGSPRRGVAELVVYDRL